MSSSSIVQLAGRYQLEDQIATGGYGQVWRATDVVLARVVAVKLLMTDHVQHPQALTRFRTEAQRAGSLSHENIARIYDYIEPVPPEPPFLVMELVDGPSVAEVLAGGPIDAARAMHVVAGAAAGLQAAHDAGLVHRDIKPANLLLTRKGRVKVTDFGISYALHSAPMTSTGMLMGTPGYLAPERLNGAGASAPADLYALGIVAYECLTGTPPFIGTPLEVAVAHRDQPLPPLPGTVPPEVAELVARLTAKDPAARPGSAGEVARWAAQLRDHLTSSPQVHQAAAPAAAPAVSPAVPQGTQPAPPPEAPSARRDAGRRYAGRWAGLAAASALVLAIIGLVAARMIGPESPGTASGTAGGRSTPGVSTVQLIEVNGKSLIGHPVSAAVQRLRGLGLTVLVNWQPADRRPPGTVLAVSPAGRVAQHSRITLTATRSPSGRGSTGTYPAAGASPAPGGNAVPVSAQSPGTGTTAPGNAPSTGAGSSPGPGPTPDASSSGSNGNGNGNGNGRGNGNGGSNGNGQGNGNGNGSGNGGNGQGKG
jgi:eukaryotic-like serine/threonine-protein kinase